MKRLLTLLILFALAGNVRADITTGLVWHALLQDNAASTTIVAAVGSNATLTGGHNTSALTTTGPGRTGLGSALAFDGTSDYIITPSINLSSTAAITIAYWQRVESYASAARILCEAPAGNYGTSTTGFQIAGDRVSGEMFTGHLGDVGYSFCNTPRPGAAAWHHMAVVFDKSVASQEVTAIYIDGVAQTRTFTNNDNNANNFGNGTIWIGARSGPTQYFNPKLADFRVYSRALSSGDALELYSNGSSTLPFPQIIISRDTRQLPLPHVKAKAVSLFGTSLGN